MDEFHFYAEPDRGWAWQVPLLELLDAQFLLMSATLGDVTDLADDLTRRTGRETAVVDDAERPVPLAFSYALTPLDETLEEIVDDPPGAGLRRALHPGRRGRARGVAARVDAAGRTGRPEALKDAAERASASAPASARRCSKLLRRGHRRAPRRDAAALPAARGDSSPRPGCSRSSAAPTPSASASTCRSAPCCSPGWRSSTATGSGCCGRASSSRSPAAPAARASTPRGTSSSRRPSTSSRTRRPRRSPRPRTRRRQPQEEAQGPAARSRPRAPSSGPSRPSTSSCRGTPEPLPSRMKVDNAMLVNVLARDEDAFPVLRRLLHDNHEDRALPAAGWPGGRCGWPARLLRSGVVTRLDEPDEHGRRYVLTVDLPDDFALNQPLAHFALAALRPARPGGADVHPRRRLGRRGGARASPRQVLFAQQRAARGEAVAEMKADGIEYEERMALLDAGHLAAAARRAARGGVRDLPADPPVAPRARARRPSRSCARWSSRGWASPTWSRRYELARSEGLVLRYLTDAYRTLRQHRARGAPDPRARGPRRPGSARPSGRPTPRCSTSGRRCSTPSTPGPGATCTRRRRRRGRSRSRSGRSR